MPQPRPVLDHVAVAVEKFADAIPVVVDQLGGRPGRGGPGRGFAWRTWIFAGGGQLEVLEPEGPPDGFLRRFLRRSGPGIHHVTFYVPDLREACARAEAAGYPVVGFDDSNSGWQEAFLFPKQALGVVVQLASSSAEHEAEGWDWTPPPGQAGAPEPVRLVGLRMAAPGAESARNLFERTLLGDADEGEGELVFHFPESPLRIAVTIDPRLRVGPQSLEIETTRAIPVVDGESPEAFGTRVTRLPA